MRVLETNNTAETRYVNIAGLQDYLTIGRNSAEKVATAAGAKIKIGTRSVYDLQKIDAYLETLSEKQGAVE